MPELKYVGSHQEVVLPDGQVVKRGELVKVSDEDAQEMEVSAAWSKSKSKSTPEKE